MNHDESVAWNQSMRHCSESEREGGAGPTRRTRSVAPTGRRLLSTAATSLSISTSDLSGGGRPARAAPTLCPRHRAPRVCRRPSCDALHVCRLYVDGFCPNGDAACRWGHAVASDGNQAALSAHQLQTLPESELLWLVRALLRQTAPVDAEEYRSQLAVCAEYAADARCGRPDCFQLHLCPQLAAGGCGAGAGCRWSHRLTDPDNVMVLLRLRCAELSEAEVLARLARSGDDQDSDSSGSERGTSEADSEPEPRAAGGGAVGGGTGQSAGPASSGQRTTPTPAPDQRSQATPVPDNPAAPGELPAKTLSKDEMLRIARTLDVCHYYGFPSKCLNKNCGKLHLCRYFIAGICPYAIVWCSRSHKLTDAHNKGLLAHHQLLKLSQTELVNALRVGYLTRNPITSLERRFLVQMCRPYQQGHCKMENVCTRVHICDGYILGVCEGSSVCGLSHNLNSQHNAAVIRDIGLFSLTARDIRKILEKPVTAKEKWESAAPKQQKSGVSASSTQTSASGQGTSSGGKKPAASPLSTASSTVVMQAADASARGGSSAPAPAPLSPAAPRRVESSTAAVTMAANTSGGLWREGTQEARAATATAGALPEGASGAGPAVGGDGQSLGSESGLGSDDAGNGGDGTGQPQKPDQAALKTDVPRGQGEDGTDVPWGQGQQDVPRGPAQSTEKSGGTDQTSQPANPGGKTTNKSVSKQLSRDSPAPKSKKLPLKTLTKEDMMQVARNLGVCRQYFFPSKCQRKDCDKLHLCRFFIACKCTYAIYKCVRSHYLWSDPHNTRVLRDHQLEKLSEQDIFRALRDGYLAQNPVTDVERRFLVQMCRPHQRGFCKRTNVCTRMHICDGYIFGKCESSSVCGLSHNLNSEHNAAVIRGIGLHSLTTKDIKAILEDPVTAKEMWESSAPKPGQKQVVAAKNGSRSHPPTRADSCDRRPPVPALFPASASGETPPQNSSGSPSQEPNKTAAVADGSQPRAAAEGTGGSQAGDESQDSESEESDDDSIELPDDGPTLCAEHSCGRRCQRADCEGFHICGFYLANLCRRSDASCPMGHSFSEAHNVRMMDVYGLLGGSPEHFQELLDQMTLRARITFSNEAEEKVSMCIPFNSPGGCTSDDCCGRFHLCNRFLAGTCTKTNCARQHDLSDEHNQRVRELLGLAAAPGGHHRHAWATDRDVVELIRARLGVKPGVYKAPEVVELVAEETESAAEEEESAAAGEVESAAGEAESAPGEAESAAGEAESAAGEAESAAGEPGEAESAPGEAESAAGEAESVVGEAESVAEDTKHKEEKSYAVIVPATDETKPTVAEAELADEQVKRVSNGAKPATDVPKPCPEEAAATQPAGGSADSGIAPLPSVCGSLISGRRCPEAGCSAVHVCPHFLAGACRRQRCTLGHRLDTGPNRRALRLAGRAVNEQNHDTLAKELYAASANVRRSQAYNKLRICISNNHVQGCRSIGCPFVHICQRFVGGTCGENRCPKGHSLSTEANRKKLRPMKLDTAPAEEVLEMLRAVHGVRSVC